jgi:hypothetical protein
MFCATSRTSENGVVQDYTVEIFGNQGWSPEQINLMTLHDSKGLQFETIFLVGLEESQFPSRYDKTKEKYDEKRRLFYLMYGFNESPFIYNGSTGSWRVNQRQRFWVRC